MTKSYRPPKEWTPEYGNVPRKTKRNVPDKGCTSARGHDPMIVECLTRRHYLLKAEEAELRDGKVTVERLEWALAMCAYLMVLDGPVYAPIYNRLERELAAVREAEDTVARAKRLLEHLGSPMQRNLLLTSGKKETATQ